MMNDRIVLYTGNFCVSPMNAAGKRVVANAELISRIGYKPVLVGMDQRKGTINGFNARVNVQGFDSYSYPLSLVTRHRYSYKAFFSYFVDFVKSFGIDRIKGVIIYGSPTLGIFNSKLISYCKKWRIPVIADITDWLYADDDRLLVRMTRQIDIEYKNRMVYKRADGVIAISSFIADYYRDNCKVIMIPPLVCKRVNPELSESENAVTQVAYAGVPFKVGNRINNPVMLKDRIDLILKTLLLLKNEHISFQMYFFGFERDELFYSLPFIKPIVEKLGNSVIFYGKLPIEDVQKYISQMDYTVLFREKNRITEAGFSTKIVESITCGTPVITTKTSDVERYLHEGVGVYFVDLHDRKQINEKMKNLFTRSKGERLNQKEICKTINCFSVESYYRSMKHFLKTIIKE